MYLATKLMHIAAVIIFLGNVGTGLFWQSWAARTRAPALLAHTMAGIIRSDRLFTVPAVLVIVGTGVAAAIEAGLPMLRTGWILWTIILFSLSGLAFMFRVAPLQRELWALAARSEGSQPFDYQEYRRLALRWEIWGAVALLTPLAGLALMVLKPGA